MVKFPFCFKKLEIKIFPPIPLGNGLFKTGSLGKFFGKMEVNTGEAISRWKFML